MALNSYLANFKDTTFTKIFVGGLPYHTTTDTLREFFEQFGAIEEAAVINDRITGKSKGYGFVTMADKAGAERAIADPNPIIDGRKANVNLAYLGAKPKLSYGALPASMTPKTGVTPVLPTQASPLSAYNYPQVTAASYGVHPGLLSLAGNGSMFTSPSIPTATSPTPQDFSYAHLRGQAPTMNLQANQLLAMAAMGYDVSQFMAAAGLGTRYMYAASPTASMTVATPVANAQAYGQMQHNGMLATTTPVSAAPMSAERA